MEGRESMRAVIQRVTRAEVRVEDEITGAIKAGLVVLLGVEENDSETDAEKLCDKITKLRIFEDEKGKMNLSLMDIKGELLVISQFTLMADCSRGRRPSFVKAAPPEMAEALYNHFVETGKRLGITTATGRFRAMMDVSLTNSGPVTLLLDSTDKKG
jgi:D-tyrosyl-tRNA(Tyr) deacylase